MTHQFLEVLRLNNRGALHIRSRRFDAAIDSLLDGLKRFKHTVETENALTIRPESERKHSSRLILAKECGLAISEETEETDSFIYIHPIEIKAKRRTIESSNALSFALIYNLALTYQLQSHSTACERQRRERLGKSKQLYELAYTLLHSEEADFGMEMPLVLANNLGHVLKDLNDHRHAEQCFELLLSTMIFFMDFGVDLDDSEMDGFIRSTSHLVLKEKAAAAA